MTGKTVCVIGAGVSGLTTIKQLLDEGHNPTCYERNDDLGGAFYYQDVKGNSEVNSVYDNVVLTISNYFMAFSDFAPSGHRRHWHHSEYIDYLKEYANKFHLNEYINYRCHVVKIQAIDNGKSGYRVFTSSHDGVESVRTFDAIAICKGSNQISKFPDIQGLDIFKGEVIHSSQYKDNTIAKGRKVLCVGMGESSADITREIAVSADSCILGIRSYPMLLPRNLADSSSDSWTTRLSHFYYNKNDSLLSYFMLLIYWLFAKRELFRSERPEKDSFLQDAERNMVDLDTDGDSECIKLIKSWNYLSKGGRFFTKNVSFVPYIVNGKIKVNASGIQSIGENSVIFNDGESYEIDTIVMCTGFQDDFSFFDGFELEDGNVRNMFMNAMPPSLVHCAFIGWCRPVTGGVPACSEITARYFSLLLSEKLSLPKDIHQRIEEDKKFYAKMLCRSPNYNSVVEWKRYMESFAELIGCLPDVKKYMFKPSIFVKLFVGSLVPFQYRLEGPHAMHEESMEVIKALDITLPTQHIIGGFIMSLLSKVNKKLPYRVRAPSKYSKVTAEFFRPDVKLTLNDIKRYTFRSDGFAEQFKQL